MIRTDEWKLIWYPQISRYQLFDLRSDPDELHDLSAEAEFAKVMANLRGELEGWLRDHQDPLLGTPAR
jgi:arylsulfatase A-like enzyme